MAVLLIHYLASPLCAWSLVATVSPFFLPMSALFQYVFCNLCWVFSQIFLNIQYIVLKFSGSKEISQMTSFNLFTEVGTHNFFKSPQSQFCNLKEALPQSQCRNSGTAYHPLLAVINHLCDIHFVQDVIRINCIVPKQF